MPLPDPKVIAPGTPVPRTPADATAVYHNHPIAPFLKLVKELRMTKYAPQFSEKTGINQGYLDTLAVLAGAAPAQMGFTTAARGEFFSQREGGEVDLTPTKSDELMGWFSYTEPEMRATAAHEFGHILDFVSPGLRDKFVALNPRFPSEAAGGPRTQYAKEPFADAFAQAVRKVVPEVGEERAYQYGTSEWLINAQQQALLDSLVKARARLLK